MKKILLALALSAAAIVPASAKTWDIARQGSWTAITGTSTNGTPMCGMNVSDAASDRAIYFKYFYGGDGITMQVFKTSWRIPQNTPVKVRLYFDKTAFSEGTAYGRPMPSDVPGGGSLVETHFSGRELLNRFFSEFAAADVMWLAFPDGNEAPWKADMVGSRAISNVFMKCIVGLKEPSQPFGKQPDTSQPFDKQKLPTPTMERGA